MIPVSSPNYCISSLSNNMLDFSTTISNKADGRQLLPDRSSERIENKRRPYSVLEENCWWKNRRTKGLCLLVIHYIEINGNQWCAWFKRFFRSGKSLIKTGSLSIFRIEVSSSLQEFVKDSILIR